MVKVEAFVHQHGRAKPWVCGNTCERLVHRGEKPRKALRAAGTRHFVTRHSVTPSRQRAVDTYGPRPATLLVTVLEVELTVKTGSRGTRQGNE